MDNESYWQSSNKYNYDYVVIGAGISGLSIAYHLKLKYPKSKIAILDKNYSGWGATGRNAGFLTIGSMDYVSKLLKESEFFVDTISENIKEIKKMCKSIIDPHNGGLSLVYNKEELEAGIESAKRLSRYGSFNVLNKNQLKDIGIDAFSGIVYNNEGSINPMKLVKYMHEKIKDVDIHEGCAVKKIDQNICISSKGQFKANKIFIASNIYSNDIEFPMKEKINLIPARNQIMIWECEKSILPHITYSTEHYLYFKQIKNNLVIGGARKFDLETEKTMEFGENKKIIDIIDDFVLKNLGGLKPKTKAKNWSGILACTEDGIPYVGKINDALYILAGLNGHGMGSSFKLAEILVESLSGKIIHEDISVKRCFDD